MFRNQIYLHYRLEVYFWGVRDLKLDKCACVRRPCVSIEIGDRTLECEMAQKNSQRGKAARQAYNFTKPRQLIQLVFIFIYQGAKITHFLAQPDHKVSKKEPKNILACISLSENIMENFQCESALGYNFISF